MIEYKISETIQDDAGRYISVKVRYTDTVIDEKTGAVTRVLLAEERLTPKEAVTDENLHASLSARSQAKYPKADVLPAQADVGKAVIIDPRYPVINEGKSRVESVKGEDLAPEGR